MTSGYDVDLAHVHDAGFTDVVLRAAPGLLALLGRAARPGALVVDLGCGSGVWARVLLDRGYRVLGVDLSEPLLALARRRAPEAEFRLGSLFREAIPPCAAVTSLGECVNYLFDPAGEGGLAALAHRVHAALPPGGLFLFDTIEPGQAPPGHTVRGFTEGDDWTVLVEKREEAGILTRRIVTFRRDGGQWRRSEETHRQHLLAGAQAAAVLRAGGFRVRVRRVWGEAPLLPGRAALIARKP